MWRILAVLTLLLCAALAGSWRPDGSTSTYDPVVPLRFERGYLGVVWDEVVLAPDRRDPQRATIMVRRRIEIFWWHWPPTGAGLNRSQASGAATAIVRSP
jgi:hypothetical protein